ncbi:MAG: hypothetical protein Kow0075_02490 [Salibacteraceae bacterium]
MKKYPLILLFSFLLPWSHAFGQRLDLKNDKVKLVCNLRHWADMPEEAMSNPANFSDPDKAADTGPYSILIDTREKKIVITDENTGEIKYNLSYDTYYQGQGQSVVLKPDESLFMVRDEKVEMVTHSAESHTLHVIHKNNRIELFGKLELIED